jgi:hypothetical protein
MMTSYSYLPHSVRQALVMIVLDKRKKARD